MDDVHGIHHTGLNDFTAAHVSSCAYHNCTHVLGDLHERAIYLHYNAP